MTSAAQQEPFRLFEGPDAPTEDDLYKCVHCGFCLQACPTYVETGLETESPRGRIALMKAVHEKRIDISPAVVSHWDLCIQCRACEPVCPSGVPYGRLIEATMVQVAGHRKLGRIASRASDLLLKRILPNQGRLSFLVGMLRLYQRSGLRAMARKLGLIRMVSAKLAELESSLPTLPPAYFEATGQVVRPFGERTTRVALLSGCVMPLIHGPQMRSVVHVLTRNGCEVVVPKDQVCCGAINTHVGDLETARDLARKNIDAFLESGVDAVIVASAGCGSRMKEYHDLLKDDPAYAEKADQLSRLTRDIHEFLVELPFVPPEGRLDYRVTYQDSCHLAHAQGITDAPRVLLRSIPGLELVEMANPYRCCGAGGTYSITQREFSLRLLDSKMQSILATEPDVVATANPGCVMQLQYGAVRTESGLGVRYVTELLDEAYRAEPKRGSTKSESFDPTAWEEERHELRSRWKGRPGDRRQRRDR